MKNSAVLCCAYPENSIEPREPKRRDTAKTSQDRQLKGSARNPVFLKLPSPNLVTVSLHVPELLHSPSSVASRNQIPTRSGALNPQALRLATRPSNQDLDGILLPLLMCLLVQERERASPIIQITYARASTINPDLMPSNNTHHLADLGRLAIILMHACA